MLAGAEKTNVAVDVPVAVALTIDGAPGTVTLLTTVIDIVAVAESVALVARTVNVVADNVPVGVPLITPVEVENVRPVGRVGVIDQEETAPPELAGVTSDIATPVVSVTDVGLILMLGAESPDPTVIEIVAVAESVALVARTVKTVRAIDSVGVPAILPFEVLKVSPAGSEGEIDQLLAVPPVFVAVTAVIALLTVAVTDDALKVILGASNMSFTVTVLVADAVFALPELSNTALAPTLRVKFPVVAETDDRRIV